MIDYARALLAYCHRCACGAPATRTVGYDDCHPVTLLRCCDDILCTRGRPESGTLPYAAEIRAAAAATDWRPRVLGGSRG